MTLFYDFLPKFSVLFSDFILAGEVNNLLLLTASLFLAITTIAILVNQKLIHNIILLSAFSILISLMYLLMDAPDVAMTEVALGSCLSTCVLLNIAKILEKRQGYQVTEIASSNDGGEIKGSKSKSFSWQKAWGNIFATALCAVFVVALTVIIDDLPKYGDQASTAQNHISKYYLENVQDDIGLPSVVAAILASYRGYDTLGETTVILIAAIAVLTILSRTRKM